MQAYFKDAQAFEGNKFCKKSLKYTPWHYYYLFQNAACVLLRKAKGQDRAATGTYLFKNLFKTVPLSSSSDLTREICTETGENSRIPKSLVQLGQIFVH